MFLVILGRFALEILNAKMLIQISGWVSTFLFLVAALCLF